MCVKYSVKTNQGVSEDEVRGNLILLILLEFGWEVSSGTHSCSADAHFPSIRRASSTVLIQNVCNHPTAADWPCTVDVSSSEDVTGKLDRVFLKRDFLNWLVSMPRPGLQGPCM